MNTEHIIVMSSPTPLINLPVSVDLEHAHRRARVMDEPLIGSPLFQSDKTRDLWLWWTRASAEAHGVPRWSSFDITEHPAFTPNLFLVYRVGEAFEFRLHGEAAIQIIGKNPKGMVVRAGEPGSFGRFLHEYYSRVLASNYGWKCTGVVPYIGREHVHFESIDLPFRRGGEPDTILGLIDGLSRRYSEMTAR